jgi:hypothetical protein
MKKKEIKELLKSLSKKELKMVIDVAEEQMNSTLGIGDSVTLTIEYMIGDANGYTEKTCDVDIDSQTELDALDVIQHILDNHTEPNKGHWGFSLTESDFGKKPDEVYNILYNQEEAPETYQNIKLTPEILETIENIVSDCFRGEAEYSFLVYQGYSLEQ